jgi:hypothetical protein
MLRPLRILLLFLSWLAAARADPALDRFAVVTTAPVSTWIYVGSVTLTATPFLRQGEQYNAHYTARVFPYFFYSESGSMSVKVPADSLRRLAAGNPIGFTGTATRSDGTIRAIDGAATPAGRDGGAIKVKIHLSKKITLVFDTTYRLADPPPVKASAAR